MIIEIDLCRIYRRCTITSLRTSKEFRVEDLGIQEQYVYDIEVEDNHNFFGNGICVHNSAYLAVNDVIRRMKWDQLDTESIRQKVDNFCQKKISPTLDEAFSGLSRRVNNPQNDILMEREIIADSSLWISKKRYLARVIDDEGIPRVDDPKMKIMGIEAVRSSTPEFCREKILEAVHMILDKDQQKLMDFITQVEREFYQQPVEEISYPRGITDIDKFSDSQRIYVKGAPIHARASALYNYWLDKYNLATKYERIQNGDRIRFVHLKLPNPLHEDVIAFNSTLPSEFELHEYIDYRRQFDGAFKKPIENIVKHVNWNMDGQQSLEDFFG